MKAEEIIRKIKFTKSDIDFALLNGAFNGSLLIDIRNAMHDYAKDQIEKDREQVIAKALKWIEHDCDNCACGCRGDWIVNNPGEIRGLPIILD